VDKELVEGHITDHEISLSSGATKTNAVELIPPPADEGIVPTMVNIKYNIDISIIIIVFSIGVVG
jgi:hypothetical protein